MPAADRPEPPRPDPEPEGPKHPGKEPPREAGEAGARRAALEEAAKVADYAATIHHSNHRIGGPGAGMKEG